MPSTVPIAKNISQYQGEDPNGPHPKMRLTRYNTRLMYWGEIAYVTPNCGVYTYSCTSEFERIDIAHHPQTRTEWACCHGGTEIVPIEDDDEIYFIAVYDPERPEWYGENQHMYKVRGKLDTLLADLAHHVALRVDHPTEKRLVYTLIHL